MSGLLGLAVVVLPFVVSPGASFTLTLANAATSHRVTWLRVAVGTGIGIAVLALFIGGTGLGSLLTSSQPAQLMLGIAGSVVLAVFGTRMLVQSLRRPPSISESPTTPPRLVLWSFLTVITNPKALSLYILVVPGLAHGELQGAPLFAAFAVLHIVLLTAWLFLVHSAAMRIPGFAHYQRMQATILGGAGVVMIGLGAALLIQAILGR